MKLKKFFRRLGTTSACIRRILDAALKFVTKEPVVDEMPMDDDHEEDGDINIDHARRSAAACNQGTTTTTAPEENHDEETVSKSYLLFVSHSKLALIFCILQPTTNPQASTKRCFLGDSWFGSVKSAIEVAQCGHHTIMSVKTTHSRFPKKFLDDTMKSYPGGTWITM